MKKYLLIICIVCSNIINSQTTIKESTSNEQLIAFNSDLETSNSIEDLSSKRIPYKNDILKMEGNYITSIKQIEKLNKSNSKKFQIIRINTYLAEIVYEYSKGITDLRENKKISFSGKEKIETAYSVIIQQALMDFSSAIKILKYGSLDKKNEMEIVSLDAIQSSMKTSKHQLIDYNNKIKTNEIN